MGSVCGRLAFMGKAVLGRLIVCFKSTLAKSILGVDSMVAGGGFQRGACWRVGWGVASEIEPRLRRLPGRGRPGLLGTGAVSEFGIGFEWQNCVGGVSGWLSERGDSGMTGGLTGGKGKRNGRGDRMAMGDRERRRPMREAGKGACFSISDWRVLRSRARSRMRRRWAAAMVSPEPS